MKKQTKVWLGILFLSIVIIGGWFISNDVYLSSSGEFGLYLVETGELIISDKDILSYNKTIHEIKLTKGGVERFKGRDLYQRKFVIKLKGIELYDGAFWSYLSSRIYEGVVIVDINLIQEDVTDSLTIEPWYPPGLFTGSEDPRRNTGIFNYFQKIGKLTQ
ncbi:MAG: hypothetical protein NWF13_05535 [Candidatus Bathyarchaeota archaeon]|nr:hypothetical protein [Candidatus Bathyarchaeota archaeon]